MILTSTSLLDRLRCVSTAIITNLANSPHFNMLEAEISDDEKEEDLYSPSAEVSDESDRNGDTTDQI
jgi:hypothetical protein